MAGRCSLCDLYKMANHIKLDGDGNKGSPIVFVGEAPGYQEDRMGVPFIGEAGKMLNSLLAKVGLKREKVFVTNTCRCIPKDVKREQRKPKAGEIKACRSYLIEELKEISPKVVVLLGNVAVTGVFGKQAQGITKLRGKSLRHEEFPDTIFLPTLHPAALLRRWEDRAVVVDDLKKAVGYLKGESAEVKVNYKVATTLEQVYEVHKELMQASSFIAFDIETSGFDCFSDEILCVSFSTGNNMGYVIPFRGQGLTTIWTEKEEKIVWRILKGILESGKGVVGQNISFDWKFIKANGIDIKNLVFDTMMAHHLLDENQPHDLDYLISRYTSLPNYSTALKPYLKSRATSYSVIPNDVLWKYSAYDAIATHMVAVELTAELKQDIVLETLYYGHVLKMIAVLVDMELYGTLVDTDTMYKLDKEFGIRIVKLLDDLRTLVKDPKFNPNSTKQLGKILFEDLKMPVKIRTATGKPSCAQEVLETLENKHPIAKQVLEFKKLTKLKNTFLCGKEGKGGGFERYLKKDNRIHTGFKAHRTVTGRVVSVDPALQLVPRPDERFNLRKLFIVPPEHYMIQVDYSQVELRVLACLAKEKTLLESFARGEDIHLFVASMMFNVTLDAVTTEQRNAAKQIDFGLIYGRGVQSIAAQLNISKAKADRYVKAFFNKFPGVPKFMESMKRAVKKHGYVSNPFGRKRRLHGIFEMHAGKHGGQIAEILRQAMNFPVQSTAAGVFYRALIRIHERLKSTQARLLFVVHDALYVEVHKNELKKVYNLVIEEMQRPVPELNNQVFPVDAKIGKCWSDESVKIEECVCN